MARRERAKGVRGELEVRDVFRAAGLRCERTPNSGGLMLKGDLLGDVPAHVEVKYQETCRPWLWWQQARGDAPAGVMPVVAFRRNRSRWLAIVELEHLADLLAAHGVASSDAPAAGFRPFAGGLSELDPRDELERDRAAFAAGKGSRQPPSGSLGVSSRGEPTAP